jgi:hypothetical protein
MSKNLNKGRVSISTQMEKRIPTGYRENLKKREYLFNSVGFKKEVLKLTAMAIFQSVYEKIHSEAGLYWEDNLIYKMENGRRTDIAEVVLMEPDFPLENELFNNWKYEICFVPCQSDIHDFDKISKSLERILNGHSRIII